VLCGAGHFFGEFLRLRNKQNIHFGNESVIAIMHIGNIELQGQVLSIKPLHGQAACIALNMLKMSPGLN
jgi:hypothetical protein